MTRLDRWLAAALTAYTFAVVTPLLIPPLSVLSVALAGQREEPGSVRAGYAANALSLTYDDGFYYLRVAQFLAEGNGSTFDGLNTTNGYHPLWLIVLVALALPARNPDTLLLSSMLLQTILAAFSTFVVFRTARLTYGPFNSLVGAMVWVRLFCSYWMPWSGMEYALHAGIFTGAMYFYSYRLLREDSQPAARPVHFAALGLLLSLAFLARLDNILLAACVAAALAHREFRRGWPRSSTLRMVSFGLPVLLSALIYAGINLWAFGHALPVSGAVKASWSARVLAQDPYYLESGWWSAKLHLLLDAFQYMSRAYLTGLFTGTVGAGAACLFVALRRSRSPIRGSFIGGPVVVFGFLQLIAYVLVFHGAFSFQPWCYVAQPWLAAMCSAWIAHSGWTWAREALAPRFRRAALTAVSIALVSTCLGSTGRAVQYRLQTQRSFFSSDPLFKVALWVREHLDRSTVIGAWNAGMISYLSQNTVVSLDGLVNSWSYHRMKRRDLCGYWEDTGITYLADALDANDPHTTLKRELDPCLDRFELIWSEPGYPGTSAGATVLRFHPRAGP